MFFSPTELFVVSSDSGLSLLLKNTGLPFNVSVPYGIVIYYIIEFSILVSLLLFSSEVPWTFTVRLDSLSLRISSPVVGITMDPRFNVLWLILTEFGNDEFHSRCLVVAPVVTPQIISTTWSTGWHGWLRVRCKIVLGVH